LISLFLKRNEELIPNLGGTISLDFAEERLISGVGEAHGGLGSSTRGFYLGTRLAHNNHREFPLSGPLADK
jgi:hypothetical protein